MGTPLGLGPSRPAQDQNLTDNQSKAKQGSLHHDQGIVSTGLNCDYIAEEIPVWDLAKAEEQYGGVKSNAFLIFGRDRPCSKAAGYGGSGHTGAGSIHLVAGLNNELKGNPSFITDAATIHISQLTDIDKNFDLVGGEMGSLPGQSGIGMKADGIRIIGRNGIKLVTTGRGDRNSHGPKIETTVGVELIAGNNDSGLEPIPKGDKVVEALNSIIERLNEVSSLVNNFVKSQKTFNKAVMNHGHQTGPWGIVPPSPFLLGFGTANLIENLVRVIAPHYLANINATLTKVERMEPYGSKYINSRYHYLN